MESVSDGQITDTGADGLGALRFILSAVDTDLLQPEYSYRYTVKVQLSDGLPLVVEAGVLIPQAG